MAGSTAAERPLVGAWKEAQVSDDNEKPWWSVKRMCRCGLPQLDCEAATEHDGDDSAHHDRLEIIEERLMQAETTPIVPEEYAPTCLAGDTEIS